MQIRLAEERDRQFLIREYLQHMSPDLEEAQKYALSNLLVDRTLIAEEGGLTLGTVHWGVREGIRSGLAQVTGLRTSLMRRRQGVGRALWTAAVEDMEGYYAKRGAALRRVFLFVPEEARAGAGLCESVGARLAAEVPGLREAGQAERLYVWEKK